MLSSVYLSGSSFDASEVITQDITSDWRSHAILKLSNHGIAVLNPIELKSYNVDNIYIDNKNPQNYNYLHRDLNILRSLDLIDLADVTLANFTKNSYSSAMEIFYAFNKGKLVVIYGQPPFNPWVLAHSNICFTDLDSAINHIIDNRNSSNPVNLALSYESQLVSRYEQFPPMSEYDYRFFGGQKPILIVSPHSTGFFKNGRYHDPITYTGSIAYVMHRYNDVYSLLANYCLAADPNSYRNTPFNNSLAQIIKNAKIGFVLVLTNSNELNPYGIGLKYNKNKSNMNFIRRFQEIFSSSPAPISVCEDNDENFNLLNFITNDLAVNAMCLELDKRFRMPKLQAELFTLLLNNLNQFIFEISVDLAKE